MADAALPTPVGAAVATGPPKVQHFDDRHLKPPAATATKVQVKENASNPKSQKKPMIDSLAAGADDKFIAPADGTDKDAGMATGEGACDGEGRGGRVRLSLIHI